MGSLSWKGKQSIRYTAPILALVFVILLANLQIPVVNTLWRESLGVSGKVTTGIWPSATPSPTATPTPGHACQLSGTLTVTPFFEQNRYGVDLKVCLTNSGQKRAYLLQILNTIQAKGSSDTFLDVLATELDLSVRPALDPGQTICYTARINFDPVKGGQYRNLIHVSASGQLEGGQPHQAQSRQASEPATLDLSANFTLPEILAPTVTATVMQPTDTQAVSATPLPTHSPTPILAPTFTETSIASSPTMLPTRQSASPTPPATSTETSVAPSPTMLPSQQSASPTPLATSMETNTIPAPTLTPTREPSPTTTQTISATSTTAPSETPVLPSP